MSVTGIVVAMRIEARCLTAQSLPFNRLFRLNPNVFIWLCGMGAVAAHHAAKELLAAGASGLASFGFAGALDPGLQPGNLVLPEAVLAEDTQTLFPVDPAWHKRLQQCLSGHISQSDGLLVTVREVVTSTRDKQVLAERTRACAVDMESTAIAAVAAEAGIPFIAVRTVSDPVGFSPPEVLLGAIQPDGSPAMLRILALIASGTVSISTLLRLGRDSRAAATTLSAVVHHAGLQLAFAA